MNFLQQKHQLLSISQKHTHVQDNGQTQALEKTVARVGRWLFFRRQPNLSAVDRASTEGAMPTDSFFYNRRSNVLFYSLVEERLAEGYIYTVAVQRQW